MSCMMQYLQTLTLRMTWAKGSLRRASVSGEDEELNVLFEIDGSVGQMFVCFFGICLIETVGYRHMK